jgi:cytochrome c5
MRWFLAAILTTAVAFAAGQNLPDGDGKAIVSGACASCHGLDLITAKQASKADWAAVVDRMKTYGAALTDPQTTTVIDYLAKSFPPKGSTPAAAPAGGQSNNDAAGKALMDASCTSCHGADVITAKKASRADWESVVDRMKSYGATLTDAQTTTLLDYLAKTYGTAPAAAATPAPAVAAKADPGKVTLEAYCGGCHDLDLVTSKKASQAEWQDTVDRMNGRGAGVPDKEVGPLVQYLAKTYGVK